MTLKQSLIFAPALLLAASLSLVACSDDSSTTSANGSEETGVIPGTDPESPFSSSVKTASSSSIASTSSSSRNDNQAESSGDACIDIAEAQCQGSQSNDNQAESSGVVPGSSTDVILSSSEGSSAASSSSSSGLVVYSSSGNVIIEFGSSSSVSTTGSDSCVYGNTMYKEGYKKTIYNLYYVCNDGEWVRYIESTVSPDPDLTYDTLVDTRDNQRYLTLEITGWDSNATAVTLTYMAQNLNYGTMTLGANEQDDDNTVEKYCYSDTAWYCEQFGGLYQWAEMMNLPYECNTQSCADQIDPDGDGFHQGICPDGWHLMNYYEASAVSNEYSYAGMKAMVLWSNAQGTNNSGFSAVGAGYRDRDGEFVELFEYVYFYYPIEHSGSPEVASYLLKLYSTGATMHQAAYKTFGSSVRCVKNY